MVQEGQVRKKYPSDLTDEQWAIVEPLIPPAKRSPRGGRPRKVYLREVLKVLSRILLLHDFRYDLPLQPKLDARGRTQMVSFKGAHFPKDIILMGIRWYVAYPLSYRHVEELVEERGVPVDHATIQRWVVKYSPQLEEAFHRHKRPVWVSWRLDETYIKVKGEWRYLYRAVDKYGQTIDFLLTEHRDTEAALRFLKKGVRRNGLPTMITIDGSDANEAAIKRYNEEHGTAIAIR
jgi:transposase-like protein